MNWQTVTFPPQEVAAFAKLTPFPAVLHVSGSAAALLDHSLAPLRVEGLAVEPAETSLEDVFIHLMQRAKDNYR